MASTTLLTIHQLRLMLQQDREAGVDWFAPPGPLEERKCCDAYQTAAAQSESCSCEGEIDVHRSLSTSSECRAEEVERVKGP